MSEPVLAGLTLLAWTIGMGVFIVVMKFCGGCRKAKCDVRTEPDPGNGTGAQANADSTRIQHPISAPDDSPSSSFP